MARARPHPDTLLAGRQPRAAADAPTDAAESDRRYRLLFDAISDAAFLVDLEELRCIEVNDAACQLYGYERDEFLALPVVEVTAEPEATMKATLESLQRLDQLPTSARTLERVRYRRWHRKRDGTRFPVEITVGPFEHEGHALAVCVVRDTTERDLAERLIETLSLPAEIDRREAQVGASVGIAVGAGGRVTIDGLLRDADAALYRAKELGRGRAMLFGAPGTKP